MAKKAIKKVKASPKFSVGEVIELMKHGIILFVDEARSLLDLPPLPPQA